MSKNIQNGETIKTNIFLIHFNTDTDSNVQKRFQYSHDIFNSIKNHFKCSIIKVTNDSIVSISDTPNEIFKIIKSFKQRLQAQKNKYVSTRICIHYGNITKIDNLYFGESINALYNIIDQIDNDEIYTTKDFYNITHDNQSITYSDHIKIDENITIYKLDLNENINLDDINDSPVICLHIVPQISDLEFINFWKNLNNFNFYDDIENKIKNKIFLDDYILIHPKEIVSTLEIIKNIADYLLNKHSNEIDYFPLQILIDTNRNIPKTVPMKKKECINEMVPGYIYISEDIYPNLNNTDNLDFIKTTIGPKNNIFYRTTLLPKWEKFSYLPLYSVYSSKLKKNDVKCFYCGSLNHRNSQCPSKRLIDNTDSISKLGYLSFEKINGLFLKMLQIENISSDIDFDKMDSYLRIAYESFFEITKVYQIRFLKLIWEIKTKNWFAIKKNTDIYPSGLLWLAVDSIRTSNHQKALKFLEESESKNYNKFKLYCIYGFYYIEKEDYSKAIDYFKKALLESKEIIYEIYIKLLISRIYYIQGRIDESLKYIREVLQKDETCIDAIYASILLYLHKTSDMNTFKKYLSIFDRNKEFFIYACIDPNISRNRDIILEKLNGIYKSAKFEAENISYSAKDEVNELLQSVNSEFIQDIMTSLNKADNALQNESYYGYLDASYYYEDTINRCKNFLSDSRNKLENKLNNLLDKLKNNLKFINKLKYKSLIKNENIQILETIQKLNNFKKNINTLNIKDINNIKTYCKEIEEQIPDIEQKSLESFYSEKLILSFFTFIKFSTIIIGYLTISLLIVIPIITSNFNFNAFVEDILNDLLYYRWNIIFWGSISSMVVALIFTLKKFFGDIKQSQIFLQKN